MSTPIFEQGQKRWITEAHLLHTVDIDNFRQWLAFREESLKQDLGDGCRISVCLVEHGNYGPMFQIRAEQP